MINWRAGEIQVTMAQVESQFSRYYGFHTSYTRKLCVYAVTQRHKLYRAHRANRWACDGSTTPSTERNAEEEERRQHNLFPLMTQLCFKKPCCANTYAAVSSSRSSLVCTTVHSVHRRYSTLQVCSTKSG